MYGHLNNVVAYSLFDTAVNRLLIGSGALDIHDGAVIGLVVETQCQYLAPMAFPDTIYAGVRVAHIGGSSVRYEVGLFRGDEQEASAQGHFIHVYVGRELRKPVPLPDPLKKALEPLLVQR